MNNSRRNDQSAANQHGRNPRPYPADGNINPGSRNSGWKQGETRQTGYPVTSPGGTPPGSRSGPYQGTGSLRPPAHRMQDSTTMPQSGYQGDYNSRPSDRPPVYRSSDIKPVQERMLNPARSSVRQDTMRRDTGRKESEGRPGTQWSESQFRMTDPRPSRRTGFSRHDKPEKNDGADQARMEQAAFARDQGFPERAAPQPRSPVRSIQNRPYSQDREWNRDREWVQDRDRAATRGPVLPPYAGFEGRADLAAYPSGTMPGKKPGFRILESLDASQDSLAALSKLGIAIDEAIPLSAKHRATLRHDIRDLWRELTSEREYRNEEYLGTAAAHSAYIRYFLPWNVYRVASVFSAADFALPSGAVVADFGSGPLTVPIALYASRPELRNVPLTIYCVDRVSRIMESGRLIFETLCLKTEGRMPPWEIRTIRASFGEEIPERAHLVTSVNLFNEFFWKLKGTLAEKSESVARRLLSYAREGASVFAMEPGDPRSGSLMSALRAWMLRSGAIILAPCPHSRDCPMPGIFKGLPSEDQGRDIDPDEIKARKYRAVQIGIHKAGGILGPVIMPKSRDKYPWCHFALRAQAAPRWLETLSTEAGLPKDRIVFSYLWAMRRSASGLAMSVPVSAPSIPGVPGPIKLPGPAESHLTPCRIISEPFALPDGTNGQYACSIKGYSLVTSRPPQLPLDPGVLVEIDASDDSVSQGQGYSNAGGGLRGSRGPELDEKSGAIIIST